MRVVGLADAVPLDPEDPYDSTNRRITIIVLNKRTEESLIRSGSKDAGNMLDVDQNTPLMEFSDSISTPEAAAQDAPPVIPAETQPPMEPPEMQNAPTSTHDEIPADLRRPAR